MGKAEGHIRLCSYKNVCPLKRIFGTCAHALACKVSQFIFPIGDKAAAVNPRGNLNQWPSLPFPYFPNHYTMLLRAPNGALQLVYTLRLGTQQSEGVPRPINHTRPCRGNEGNGFRESRWSGQIVGHVDGWLMVIWGEKPLTVIVWCRGSALKTQNISSMSL